MYNLSIRRLISALHDSNAMNLATIVIGWRILKISVDFLRVHNPSVCKLPTHGHVIARYGESSQRMVGYANTMGDRLIVCNCTRQRDYPCRRVT